MERNTLGFRRANCLSNEFASLEHQSFFLRVLFQSMSGKNWRRENTVRKRCFRSVDGTLASTALPRTRRDFGTRGLSVTSLFLPSVKEDSEHEAVFT